MTSLPPPLIRRNLKKLSAHIVVALIALVVVGGATRVMEAGLACPDWPLCYGSFFPKGQMNIQVFLEWFHRLDAFFVGVAIFFQFIFTLIYRSYLPKYFLWFSGLIFSLILIQGLLGALTVFQLLPSAIVSTHLTMGLALIALMSGFTQRISFASETPSPFWWQYSTISCLLAVIGQCLIGSLMATSWASQRCLNKLDSCFFLDLHSKTAIPITLMLLAFVFTSLYIGGWFRRQWPFLLAVLLLVFMQIGLGILSVRFSLNEASLIVGHQLVAALLVALLAALSFRRPTQKLAKFNKSFENKNLEVCHG